MDTLSNIGLGLQTALSAWNLFYCFVGVFLGTVIGVIPGLGAITAIALLFPLTFQLEPTTALIMLAGIWYGTAYGGSIASILLHVPGTPANAVACFDGYPMTRQGRAGVALSMTAVSSFVGGSIGIILLMLFTPAIASIAYKFGPAEYFTLMVLGLVAASTISETSAAKGLAMVAVGVALGVVGLDMYTGASRFTFGTVHLHDGISLVAVVMGLFGITEVVTSIGKVSNTDFDPKNLTLRSLVPTRDDVRRSWMPMLRGSAIGSFIGALPGVGSAVACFLSYGIEKRVAEDPSRFGKGAIEGVIAPEAANNAGDQTAFIPTLALGVPGSPTMAIMLGALIIHGITPGPGLITNHPELFWGLVMSFWIGNLILVILNIPLVGLWVRLLLIPYSLLFPAILFFICIGTFSAASSVFDIWMVLMFGVVGYFLRLLTLPAAPLILGFVLGPLMEEHFRRAMLISRGSFSVFIERPISLGIVVATVLVLIWAIWSSLRQRQFLARAAA